MLRFAKFENVTQIVVGRSRGGFLSELLRRSLPHELVRRTQDIAIHLVTRASDVSDASVGLVAARRELRCARCRFSTPRWRSPLRSAIGKVLTELTPIPNLSIVFLLAVLVSAINFGVWPAIYASVLSFFVYNFFFIPPLYNFTIAEPYELLALVIFLVVAVVTSAMAGRVREQARVSADRVRAMRRLYEFTRRLSGLATRDAIAEGAAGEIHASLARPVVVLLAEGDDLALTAAWPPEDALDAAAMTAARWAYTHTEPAGADTGTLPIIPWYFVPLRIGDKTLGVIGVAKDKDTPPFDSEARALLDTLSEQTAAALERASLAREMVSARTATETERVRNTLLASISHDFRTPLSSILGAATSLLSYGDKLDAAAKTDLLGQIKQETEGLDEMVRNLLAITRIDAGALELRRDWIDLREIVERVVSAARRRGALQRIDIAMPSGSSTGPCRRGAGGAGHRQCRRQCGCTHVGKDTHIVIDAQAGSTAAIVVCVTDDGPGIASDVLPHIFDRFVKGKRSDEVRDGGEGTGLGLAIAKGIMEAHGGSIAVESPVDEKPGARFVLTFPREDTAS